MTIFVNIFFETNIRQTRLKISIYKRVAKLFKKKQKTQCLKITQNVPFSFNFCPVKIDLSGNTVWPQTSGFQKLAKLTNFGISMKLLRSQCLICNETFSVIFKHCENRQLRQLTTEVDFQDHFSIV